MSNKKSTLIFDTYSQFKINAIKNFNTENIIVLLQVGSFYEIYDDGSNIKYMENISCILNMQLTKKNKSNPDINKNNPLLIGFPCLALHKYLNKLLEYDFIVLIAEQTIINGKIERRIKNVYTKTINENFDENNYTNNNWLMCVELTNYSLCICILDVILGESKLFFSYDKSRFYELINFVKRSCSPKEIILFSESNNNLDLNCAKFDYKFHSINESNELLSRIYPTSLITPIEYVNLDKYPDCLNVFISTIKYAYTCNEKIIDCLKINIPEVQTDSRYLHINSNCVDNLDLVYLQKILNNCMTNSGKREFLNRFMNPLQDKTEIDIRLNKIDFFYNQPEKTIQEFNESLKHIKDIHLLIKKLKLNKFDINIISYVLKYIYISLKYILNIVNLVEQSHSKIKENLNNVLLFFDEHFNFNNQALIYFILPKFIKVYELENIIENIIKVEDFKFEGNEIVCSSKKTTKEIIKNENALILTIYNKNYYIKDFEIVSNKTTIKLYNQQVNNEFNTLKQEYDKLILDYYHIFISNNLFENFNFKEIVDYITDFDISFNNYKNSVKFKHFKPQFNENNTFIIDNIRHPIIEINNKDIEYVKNNINFDKNGMLLYGINSIGKSSLIKSIGICIILAQNGMYVPSDNYNVYIIDKILTRFPSSDNLINNKSSFILEIEDIRDILYHSTNKSLILADEICQNTETYSGISIISATINFLLEKQCKFIIATHLQELIDLDFIKNACVNSLKICHLSITQNGDDFIFDRKLKDGPFHSLYGLEICKSLNLSKEFLEFSYLIRNSLLKTKSSIILQKSKYNSSVFYKNYCQVCNNNHKFTKFHIHHILEQELADSNGYIGLIHKNDKFNLVTLCESCHKKVHNKEIVIHGYQLTNNGIKLNFNLI